MKRWSISSMIVRSIFFSATKSTTHESFSQLAFDLGRDLVVVAVQALAVAAERGHVAGDEALVGHAYLEAYRLVVKGRSFTAGASLPLPPNAASGR